MSFTHQAAIIRKVRIIPASSKVKNTVVIIQREGYPNHDIVRTEASFLIDLKESRLIDASVTSLSHPSINRALLSIEGTGTVSGMIENVEAGSKYTLDENSSEVKANPALLGEERERTRATALVERGQFLSLRQSIAERTLSVNAEAYASSLSAMLSMFSAPQANATATPTPAEPATTPAVAPAPAAAAAVPTV